MISSDGGERVGLDPGTNLPGAFILVDEDPNSDKTEVEEKFIFAVTIVRSNKGTYCLPSTKIVNTEDLQVMRFKG